MCNHFSFSEAQKAPHDFLSTCKTNNYSYLSLLAAAIFNCRKNNRKFVLHKRVSAVFKKSFLKI